MRSSSDKGIYVCWIRADARELEDWLVKAMATSMACTSATATSAASVATSSSSSLLSAAAVTSSNNASAGHSLSFASHSPRPPELHSLRIHTKSIEQTLIPLVTQVGENAIARRRSFYIWYLYFSTIGINHESIYTYGCALSHAFGLLCVMTSCHFRRENTVQYTRPRWTVSSYIIQLVPFTCWSEASSFSLVHLPFGV